MREFTCVVCGKKGIYANQVGKLKRYCSPKCRDVAFRSTYGWGGEDCKFNKGVACDIHQCETCGWNPAVEKMRIEELRKAVI